MGKVLTWILVGLLAWCAFKMLQVFQRRARSSRSDDTATRGGQAMGEGGPRADSERMVRCVHCGVHLPASEAIVADGRVWCSAAHRDARGAD